MKRNEVLIKASNKIRVFWDVTFLFQYVVTKFSRAHTTLILRVEETIIHLHRKAHNYLLQFKF
jgi:hypothetical protein